MIWLLIQSLINGIFVGGVYALLAMGITIIFGVMRMINFASGAYMMCGMYFTWLGYYLFRVSNYALLPFTIVASAILAYLSFKAALKPIIKKERSAAIIVTVGLSFFLQNIVLLIFGPAPLTVPSSIQYSSISIGSFIIGLPRLYAFIIALIFAIMIQMLLTKTSYGRQMRATSENIEIAEMLGINTDRIFATAWTLGIVLMGITGLIVTPMYLVQSSIGGVFRSTGLMAVILGGLGNTKGSFIGGLILGIVEALVATFVAPDLGPLGMFLLFLVVLYFKPYGMFGKGERIA